MSNDAPNSPDTPDPPDDDTLCFRTETSPGQTVPMSPADALRLIAERLTANLEARQAASERGDAPEMIRLRREFEDLERRRDDYELQLGSQN